MIYQTPPLRIGKHEWRAVVLPSRSPFNPTGRCLEYQWRRQGAEAWRSYRDWPRFDLNDGTNAGLPRSVARLYQQHKSEIAAALRA